jgi:pilus assembly protein FimV
LLGEPAADSPAKPAEPIPAAAAAVAEDPASAPFWTAPKAEPQT